MPSLCTGCCFTGTMPSLCTDCCFPGTMPSLCTDCCFTGTMPSLCTDCCFTGTIPSFSIAHYKDISNTKCIVYYLKLVFRNLPLCIYSSFPRAVDLTKHTVTQFVNFHAESSIFSYNIERLIFVALTPLSCNCQQTFAKQSAFSNILIFIIVYS